MSKFKWAALGVATAIAVMAVVVPGATSAPKPGLKVTSVFRVKNPAPGVSENAKAKCPRGYSVVGGGFGSTSNLHIASAGRVTNGRYSVFADPVAKAKSQPKIATQLMAQAICIKGTGGFQIDDDNSSLP